MIKNPHTFSINDVLADYQVDPNLGLSAAEVQKRFEFYGENTLTKRKPKSSWLILFEQFINPIIYVLGIAMFLAFVFGEWLEGFAVLVVILVTTMIGFFMERQAIKSLESLRNLATTMTNVIRESEIHRIRSSEVVPGDVLILEPGDIVPADARLIWHQSLAVKEAILTGESSQVEKTIESLPNQTSLIAQTNMVFKGTMVVRGNAKAIVTHIGDKTQMGKISKLTQEAITDNTPLEKRLNKLSQRLIILTLVLATVIVISGYFQGKDITLMIKTGIALAVAAIPEGLPIVAIIALAKGMLKLSKQKVIIKKLEAVQTLGETNIICTDKTGTLTENKMTVHHLVLQDSEINFEDFENEIFLSKLKDNDTFKKLIEVAVLCNNATQQRAGMINGDSIEAALIDFAEKVGYSINDIRSLYPEINELPFDTERKLMATINQYQDYYLVAVKGAIEKILEACEYSITEDGVKPILDKKKWTDIADRIASEGLRVLAFAYKEVADIPDLNASVEEGLIFIGVVGFLDPPRKDIRQAIKIYKDAGIKVVMITGDHPKTARKIAEEIGLLTGKDISKKIIHGKMLADLQELESINKEDILHANVFARMVPKQKLDLVSFYQKHNAIVGMIGDGVNDTPALKKADIGIAMGIRGTEAAKEVSDVILMDDQFTSTELAIRQRRTIFVNIRHFVMYLLSCNLAEIIAVTAASLSNLPLPLLPFQILFLNLVTDIFPALALGMGKGSKDMMKQLPRDPKEPIMTRKHWGSTIVYGLSITMAVIGITVYSHLVLKLSQEEVNNMAFYTLILAQLFNVFNIPHNDVSFFKNEVTSNVWVWAAIAISLLIVLLVYCIPLSRKVLSLVPLTLEQFVAIFLFALSTLLLTQIVKRLGATI